jgi:uncharacterized protein YcfL
MEKYLLLALSLVLVVGCLESKKDEVQNQEVIIESQVKDGLPQSPTNDQSSDSISQPEEPSQ